MDPARRHRRYVRRQGRRPDRVAARKARYPGQQRWDRVDG